MSCELKAMKQHIKLILVTVTATTIFWSLVLAGFVWWSIRNSGFRRDGYLTCFMVPNHADLPATVIVDEFAGWESLSKPSAEVARKAIPPGQKVYLGIRISTE